MAEQNMAVATPQQVVEGNIKAGITKANMPLGKMCLLGILAGMFIAGGGAASSCAMHAVGNVGLARFVAGCIFPVGLMMIVFIGGELFTGNCMMIMGVMDKQYSVWKMLRNLGVVYLTNLVGAVLFAYMIFESGQLNYSGGMLGAFTIKVAIGKVRLPFYTAFISGILCNIFVCGAVLMASATKSAAGKVWAIFFPIMAFVVSGFEHCVANMYYIPAGMMALTNEEYKTAAMESYGYSAELLSELNIKNFLIKSAIPVTLGNIVGGMVFVGVILYLIHGKQIREARKAK